MPGASKFMVQILGAVAENERDMISERTKAALARAKANGKQLGPPDPVKNIATVLYDQASTAETFRAQHRPAVIEMRRDGMTFQQIADQFARDHIPTPSGRGHWQAVTVMRLLEIPNGLNLGPTTEEPVVDHAGELPLFTDQLYLSLRKSKGSSK